MKTFYEFFELFGKKKTVFVDYVSNKYQAYYDDNDEKKKIYVYGGQDEDEIRSKIIKKFGKYLKLVWVGDDYKKPYYFKKSNITEFPKK